MSRRSYLSLCAQYPVYDITKGGLWNTAFERENIPDFEGVPSSKYYASEEFWWILTKGFWEFLKSVHDGSTCSSMLRGSQPIRRMIFEYLKPRDERVHYRFCNFTPCAKRTCKFSECEEHGWGEIYYDAMGVDDYLTHTCLDCNRHYCWRHFGKKGFTECQVCTNLYTAECNLGCYDHNAPVVFFLCPKHPAVRCTKLIDDDYDGEGPFDGEDSKGDCGDSGLGAGEEVGGEEDEDKKSDAKLSDSSDGGSGSGHASNSDGVSDTGSDSDLDSDTQDKDSNSNDMSGGSDDSGGSYDVSSDNGSAYSKGKRICGFYCCKSCLKDHRCGDDPSEYC